MTDHQYLIKVGRRRKKEEEDRKVLLKLLLPRAKNHPTLCFSCKNEKFCQAYPSIQAYPFIGEVRVS
jgi:hypothetical protein